MNKTARYMFSTLHKIIAETKLDMCSMFIKCAESISPLSYLKLNLLEAQEKAASLMGAIQL